MKTLSRDGIQRIAGGVSSNTSTSGGGGGGGSAGISSGWVEANFLSKEFFSLLFDVHISTRVLVKDGEEVISDTTTAGVLTPNDIIPETATETDPETGYITTTTVTLTSIEAKSNFWSSLAISALGQGSGGGGGGATALSQLVDVQLSNLQNGQALVYDSTLGKWVNANVHGGSTAWADITGKPTTISGYGITDAYINNGTIVIGNNSITPVTSLAGYATQSWVQNQGYLTSSAISDMATKTWVQNQGYLTSSAISDMATKTWVNQQGFLKRVSGTFWGNSWSNGDTLSGNIIIDNGYAIRFKNGSGDSKNVLALNSSNQLAIGYNTRQMGYVTDIQGDPITFATNNGTTGGTDNRLEVGEFSSAGRFWIKQGTQGLRIGNGLLTWDSSNNALKVSDAWGNSANLYALGAVSALGFSSSGGSTSIDSLTINSSILVKDYADTSLKAISVTKATSSTTVNYLNIGETWKSLYHDTRVYGYNVQLVSGNGAYIMNMNGAGKVTCPNYLQASRIYLDSSRYLYISGSSLIFSDGSTSRTVATL